MAIITTDIDVNVFPSWLYGRIQMYVRKRALLNPILDIENDRIIGIRFSTDPDYDKLRNTKFRFGNEQKKLIDWITTKKYKFDDSIEL